MAETNLQPEAWALIIEVKPPPAGQLTKWLTSSAQLSETSHICLQHDSYGTTTVASSGP